MVKIIRFMLLISAFSGVWGCTPTIKLRSQVVEQNDSSKPVRGAKVQVLDETGTPVEEAVTDSIGNFLIEIPKIDKSKNYELVIAKELVSDVFRQPLNLMSKSTVPENIRLPIRGAVRGVIFEEGRMATRPDSRVAAADILIMRNQQWLLETRTGNDGMFVIGRLDGARYKFRIARPAYYPAETNYIDVKNGSITQVEIPLQRIPEGDVIPFGILIERNEWKPVTIKSSGPGVFIQP